MFQRALNRVNKTRIAPVLRNNASLGVCCCINRADGRNGVTASTPAKSLIKGQRSAALLLTAGKHKQLSLHIDLDGGRGVEILFS